MTSILNSPHFTIGFPAMPQPVAGVWCQLIKFLALNNVLPKTIELSQMTGHPANLQAELPIKVPVEKVEMLILERNLKGFQFYGGSGAKSVQYFLTDYGGFLQDSVMACYLEKSAKGPPSWTRLIQDIMSQHPSVGAWQFMGLYHFWQRDRTTDRFYEMRWGERPPGFRTWAEPSRPVTVPRQNRVFLDISLNPGRTKQLTAMIEFYPTAEMWLGPDFWQYAKCTKEEALAAGFWLETRDTPHYTYFKCWPTAFTRPDGEQGRMQQNLWKLFFHEDCEWPPGSGTICDEPMYGPPELMPQPPTSPN